jgi:tRNA (cytosine38-C5)-methyltransferase
MALEKAVSVFNEACSDDFSSDEAREISFECCAAMDHSDLCNAVYQHNFLSNGDTEDNASISSRKPLKSVRIEQITVQDLLNWNANLWMMSPPCQPHTRQHENQANDIHDTRSDSFLHICQLLQNLEPSTAKPSIIVLENVVGFESSNSFHIWMQSLSSCNYAISQFHLQPTQVGIPNDRPRYYCLAVRGDVICRMENRKAVIERYFSIEQHRTDIVKTLQVAQGYDIYRSMEEMNVLPDEKVDSEALPELFVYLDTDGASEELRIPDHVLQRPSAWCLDIVTPFSRRTSCFTSAYGKYFKGTGSVLLVPNRSTVTETNGAYRELHQKYQMCAPEDREYDANWASDLIESGCSLRYFSGAELAQLFGFSGNFSFPSNVSVKQQWKLMGNSLNVHVAAKILELGLHVVMH